MLTALWPWPWPWSKTITTIANMPNCTARLVDKPPPLSLCIVICFRLPEALSLAVLLAGCIGNAWPEGSSLTHPVSLSVDLQFQLIGLQF
jgi:hypothetical protein